MQDLAERVRTAQRLVGGAAGATRTAALNELAGVLVEQSDAILEANEADVEAARQAGVAAPLQARLQLTRDKLDTLCTGLRTLANGGDPVGRPLRKTRLDDGLVLTQVTSPLGVLLIIFESRPDAVIQIAGLGLRTGNGLLLKGGSEAARSNAALVTCIQTALERVGLPPSTVESVASRSDVAELLELDSHIDLVIPRGSGALVQSIQSSTRIPVLGHAEGICHLYLDRAADPEMAARLAIDGKCDYPAACNATETLLVHRDFLPHLRALGDALHARGVALRADARAHAELACAEHAGHADGATEYGDLILAVRTVDDIDAAIDFIHTHGSGHTESIVTDDPVAADRFLDAVDSASVFHNASTRFADGFRYGLGAEVGISTGRIHARGPVGADGLLTTRWLLRGSGQCAGDYGPNGRAYLHAELDPDQG